MNPHRLGWGFAYNFPFAAIAGGVTLLAYLFSKEPKSFPITGITILLILFNIHMAITTYFAINLDEALQQWDKVLKIQFMVFVSMAMINSKERIRWLVWIIAMSIGFFGVKGGVFTVLSGGNHMVLGPPDSFIAGNTEVGLALIMILPLIYFLYFFPRIPHPKRC